MFEKSIPFFIVFKLLSICLIGQVANTTSGMSVSSPTGSITLSIGQSHYEHFGKQDNLTGGVLQVFQPMAQKETLRISVGPNPVFDQLSILIEGIPDSGISYQLFDLFGLEVENKKINGLAAVLSMKDYLSGTFILVIHSPNRQPVLFKIIKL